MDNFNVHGHVTNLEDYLVGISTTKDDERHTANEPGHVQKLEGSLHVPHALSYGAG